MCRPTARNPLGRALGRLWSWLQALPFIPIIFVLRLAAIAMPQARYIGPYQNWPLIWLYRTADGWYRRSLAAFQQLGEETGAARAELQLAEIERLFGYPGDALAQLDRLRAAPVGAQPVPARLDRLPPRGGAARPGPDR